MDPKNSDAFVSKKAENYWGKSDQLGAVDLYLGGAEHAVLHLLYARFWHMVLYDLDEVSSKEPFNKLFNQGMILGAAYKNESGKYFALDDVEKIDEKHYSKSTKEELSQSFGKIGKRYKNGIAPEDVCNKYGIDTIRLYLMYLGPLEQNKPWDYTSIKGMSRLLDKLYALKVEDCGTTNEVKSNFNTMLEKINQDLAQLKFNTAIAAFIIFLNSVKVVSHETYKKILIILIKLQNIKVKKIKNFKKNFYKIPNYSKTLIYKEASLFLDWYVPYTLNKQKRSKIKKELKKSISSLLGKIQLPNNTFVHRDFHVSNLMFKKNKISVIDSQDALYGNTAYDLASLIDDARLETSDNLKEMIYQYYLYLIEKKINEIKFKNDFEILSVLRNLKVIGIFTRLAVRDGKRKYLKLIPHAWKLIENRVNNNDIFKDLRKNLEDNFPKKIRIKNES